LKKEQVDKIIYVPQIWLTKDNVEQYLKAMQ
jgi:hypothetical protein